MEKNEIIKLLVCLKISLIIIDDILSNKSIKSLLNVACRL